MRRRVKKMRQRGLGKMRSEEGQPVALSEREGGLGEEEQHHLRYKVRQMFI